MAEGGPGDERVDRAERARAERAERARAPFRHNLEARRAQFAWQTVTLMGVVGVLASVIAVASVVGGQWWGLVGGLLMFAAVFGLWWQRQHWVGTVEPADGPAHRRRLGVAVLTVALIVGGLLVAAQPWR